MPSFSWVAGITLGLVLRLRNQPYDRHVQPRSSTRRGRNWNRESETLCYQSERKEPPIARHLCSLGVTLLHVRQKFPLLTNVQNDMVRTTDGNMPARNRECVIGVSCWVSRRCRRCKTSATYIPTKRPSLSSVTSSQL